MALININLPASCVVEAYREAFSNTSAPAGTNNQALGVVPPGQVWQIESACCWDRTTAIDAVAIYLASGASSYCLAILNPVGIHDGVYLNQPVTLFPGEGLVFQWRGVVLNDDIFGDATGVKYAIELL